MSQEPKSPPCSSTSRVSTLRNNAGYRYLTLLAVQLLERVRPRHGNVLMLTSNLCVKYGRRVHLSEASTMQFISQRTSIPVPKVLCAFTHAEQTYIVMERIKGEILGSGWVDRREQSKSRLLAQLSRIIVEMRQLQPPDSMGVASVDGGSLYDCRVPGPGPTLRFGPFSTIKDFHRHLRRGMEFDSRLDAEIRDLITQHESGTWPLVFTHGDLSSLNILVSGDDIVGIVDWETAGWYPSYWEYTSAYQVNPQNSFWANEIDKFLEPMPDELAMERIRQKHFGDI
ncbi:uncharacterized protein DSM5745_01825 [Aspergillus mulundensis]|uniref:Aminoglycoside phosphotransferase domain-containing protein n=1 Tax=Aspergillus mulundensis TaxID=1810919 RepID=A0A3D8SUT2_9EURO|nr:Uncharacterized protein DSM5745_01825 [Aspergillus mulundensis]RDW90050.1 Uncharacterized protein DSM5745_01825 [Aspergillus mulundensis]